MPTALEYKLKAVASREWVVTRIQDEIDKLIKIISELRDRTEKEIYGFNFKGGIPAGVTKQVMELATTLEKLVNAKIKFEKASKELAEAMTPEEEKSACLKYIQSLTAEERHNWIKNLKDWMKTNGERWSTPLSAFRPKSGDELVSEELADEPLRGDDSE